MSEPKERPILFKAEMVRAVLAGTKTQTRRVVNPQPPENHEPPHRLSDGRWVTTENEPPDILRNYGMRCPYGEAGDRLWVRERQRVVGVWPLTGERPLAVRVRYEADGIESTALPYPDRLKGTPEIGKYLSYGGYRESSRIDLDVLSVRVERVQDVSEADARAEGVTLPETWAPGKDPTYRHHFAVLWDSINEKRNNGAYSWDSNPFVWVVEFRRAG